MIAYLSFYEVGSGGATLASFISAVDDPSSELRSKKQKMRTLKNENPKK